MGEGVATCDSCGDTAPEVAGSSPCGWDVRGAPRGDLCEACAGKPSSGALYFGEPCHCCGKARHGRQPGDPNGRAGLQGWEQGEIPF